MKRGKVVTGDAADRLDSVAAKFSECDCQTLPVTWGGALVGLVTTDNLSEFMRMRAAAPNVKHAQ